MSFLLVVATISVVSSLRVVVSSVAILISLRVMVSAMTVMISFRVMISTVTTTMTGPMPVMVPLVVVVVVTMVVVIKNRAQCDKRDRRRNNAVIMICTGWCARQGQSDQTANRHDSKLVGLQLFHFNLHFISTMAAM